MVVQTPYLRVVARDAAAPRPRELPPVRREGDDGEQGERQRVPATMRGEEGAAVEEREGMSWVKRGCNDRESERHIKRTHTRAGWGF